MSRINAGLVCVANVFLSVSHRVEDLKASLWAFLSVPPADDLLDVPSVSVWLAHLMTLR